ncbi:MAG: hypothetical protein IT432_07820 [Phycisphaerales bacterium]|nr:hypothetical protein [Phycisphaerales bacterium]
MNASIHRNLAALVLAAGTTLGVWTPACNAQTEPPSSDKTKFAAVRVPSTPITIRFQGGVLAEYVKAVQAQRGENDWPVNVILGPGTDRIVVRPVDLKFVSVDTAMEALVFAAEGTPGELRIDHVSAHQDESPTFSVIRKDINGHGGSQELEVVSIAQLTRPSVDGISRPDLAIKPDVVLSAVELALPAGDEPARVKYHEESQLLILQGSLRATNAVQRVINTMINDQRQRLGDAGRSQRDVIEAKARVERAEIRLATAEQSMALMREKLERVSELAKAGSASDGDVQEQRNAYGLAESTVLTARADLQEATALAGLIESKWTPDPSSTPGDDIASLRKVVEDQAAQIKALTEELSALRKQKNAK